MTQDNKAPDSGKGNSEQKKTSDLGKTVSGLQPNVAGLLCYLVWWVSGLVFLIIEKDNKFVRFHAWQSIFIFASITIIQIILAFIPLIGWILGIIIWVLSAIIWVVCMMNAYQGKLFKLPIVGNIAEKQN